MLKAVENRNDANVIDFPKCQLSECRYATQCPVREQLYKAPQNVVTSALFVGVSNGRVGINGLSNIAPHDVRPLMRALGAALLKLCRIYKKSYATNPMSVFNLSRFGQRRKHPSHR